MCKPSDFDGQIRAASKESTRQGALLLEQLYRDAVEHRQQNNFRAALTRVLSSSQPCTLLEAWGFRLDILPLAKSAQTTPANQFRSWSIAVPMSILLGMIWTLLSGGKPPMPFPDQAAPLFWLGWAPITALFVMGFIVFVDSTRGRRDLFVIAAFVIIALGGVSGWQSWGRKDAAAILTAFHLPLLVWMTLGAAVTSRIRDVDSQRMSFVIKSAESLVTSGIYLAIFYFREVRCR